MYAYFSMCYAYEYILVCNYITPLEWIRRVCLLVYTREMYWSPYNVYGCTCWTNPILFLFFWFLIFGFFNVLGGITVRNTIWSYVHTITATRTTPFFFNIFLLKYTTVKYKLWCFINYCTVHCIWWTHYVHKLWFRNFCLWLENFWLGLIYFKFYLMRPNFQLQTSYLTYVKLLA